MKRTISILVIIAMMLASVLAIIPVGAAEEVEGGDSVVEDTTPVGTAVATADEFKAAVEAGKDFYLTENITLPADWAAKDFGATFDGNEKIVTLTGTAGLFAVLDGATIKNVAVMGETTVNGIANGAKGAVRFENVSSLIKTVQGDDKAAAFVGGQISPASITFVKCTNYTNVVGGLTGGAFASWVQAGDLVFEDCSNFGNVKASYAGGFVGAPQCANITVKNATNGSSETKVVVEGSTYTGGLFGESYATITIDGLANYVHAKNGKYISAVVAKTTKNYTIKNAAISEILDGGNVPAGGVLGYVDDNNIVFRAENVTITGQHNVKGAWNRINGGFVGHVGNYDKSNANTSEFYFVDCLMSASTPTNNCNFGGFFGGHHNSTGTWYKVLSFVRCINKSDIKMGGNIGGFVGQCNAQSYYFEDCVNDGNINSTGNQAGGFFGWGSGTGGSFKAIRCINNGTITTNGKNSAGFASNRGLSSVYFEDCINNGELVGGTTCGFIQAGSAKPQFVCCVNNFAGAKKQFSDKADEIVVSYKMNVTPTAATVNGPIMVDAKVTDDPENDAWIAMVKDGDDASTIYVQINKTPYAGPFDILNYENSVKQKDITSGYYTLYLCPNDGYVTEILDGTLEVVAQQRIFLADNLITKPEDLLTLKEGGIYALAADLTLPEDYIPVDFAASLDGDGHTITLTGKTGLFNVVKNATIKNLTINANIESDAGVGALAVTTQGNVVVDGVTVKGSIKGGEIAGFFQYVNAEGTNVTITNSKNDANLTGTKKTAGFIAYANKNAVIVIDNCVNNGAITRVCPKENQCNNDSCCGYNSGAGFIANCDQDSNVTIKNSVNNGAVYGSANVAGFTGYTFGKITLENCVNNGRIETTNTSSWAVSAAGLVAMFANGGNNSVLTIKGCTNNADIYLGDAGYEGAGGMVGSAKWVTNTEIYFEDSVNVGDIHNKSVSGNYGGFLGWGSSIGTVSFKNCTNYGSVSGKGNNGGFLGQVGTRKLMNAENCVNYGDITSTGNMPGGFAGWCNNSADGIVTIDGFTNYGVITAGSKQASACLAANDNAVSISIKNVTNYGHIKGKTGAAVAIAAGSKAVCENIVNEGMMTGEKIIGEFTNNGTFGEFIEINNAEDFLAIKPGYNYKLMNNIVLPEDYVGAIFGSQWYTTEFDGNGKTIYMKGLKSPLFDTVHNAKFYNFKVVGSINAPAAIAREISNFASELIVTDVVVDVDINNNKNTGGFFEWVRKQLADDITDTDTRNIVFTNCAFLGNITTTGGSRTGGFGSCWELDNATLTFNNCVVGDKGLTTAIKGNDGRVAGFVGKIEGMTKTDNVKVNFNNCVNYADIAHTGTTNEGASGAFAGRVVNVNVTLNNCDNYGDVSSNRGTTWIQGVGGLVGEANRNVMITIDGSNNYGNVYARRSVVGGLLGAVTNASKATIKNSANFGNVENGKDWNFYAGGIVGSTNDNSTGKWTNYKNEIVVDNCQNYGTITTQNANTGGVVGGIEGAGNTALLSVTNCANYGKMNLVGGNNVGGIIGQGTSGTKTIVEGNVNYGYIAGATSNHGVAAIMALPYATANELIVKNNANYGIVEGGAGSAYVAGITADTNAGKYTYEGNVNYGTIIGTKENTSGICALVNDKADSTFAANYNYGIIVAAKANLVANAPATVDAGNNYAGGVVVTNADNQALVKALASPYNYDVMGAGRDAWMDLVAALAAAEGVEIPDEPVVTPELVETVIDFTKLTYKAYAGKEQTIDAATGSVKNPVALTEYAKTAEHYKFTATANELRADHIGDAGTLFYIADQTLPITADTYYEYYLNAKNNRNTGYAGIPFAMANGVPYFLYGAFHNTSDIADDVCEMRICAGRNDCELYVPGGSMKDTYVQASVKQDLVDGFGQMKIVIDGYTASFYTVSGGEWVKLVFVNKDIDVSVDSVQLPEGSVFTPGSIFNRDGTANKQRTITIRDAKYLAAPAEEAPATFALTRAISVEDAIAALVDKTALNEAKVELAAMGDVAEDDAKAVALKAAIEAMEKATTQAEIDDAAATLDEAVKVYVDLSALNYQLAEAEKHIQTNYTAGTWYEFAKALEAAKAVDVTDQAAVDAAAAALDAAIYGLADISELTDMTQKAIAKAESLLPENFGSAGWAVMVEKLAVAKQAFADLNTELMDIAVVELNTAIDALISVEELKALIAELTTIDPANYSVVSYAPVAPAVVVGLTTIDPVEQAPVDNALALLRAAKAGLVDVTELNAVIAEAEAVNGNRYTEASYAKLLNAVASAKLVIMSADNAEDIAAAKADVEAAQKALRRKTTLSTDDLEALIEEVEALDASIYTAETWDAVKVALAAAKVALYADTQGKIRDAETALQEAYDALVEKTPLVTDALTALIAEVEALDFTNYTTETWSAVSAALIEAKVALRGDDQAAIDTAKAALEAAKAALAEKPVLDLPELPTEPEQPTEQPTEKPTEKPTEPADEKGCGSAIGATVVVMTAVLGLGATVVLKKKED